MAEEKRSLESTTRTFNTTEGTLTYAELSDKIAPKLLALLDDIVNGKYSNHTFNEELILEFHKRITSEIMPQISGTWRTVLVGVGNWVPPEPYEIPMKMHEYVQNVQERFKHADNLELQLELLAYAEGEFLHIHPFQDFNGRTIRAILLELLIRLNLPPVDTAVERDTNSFKEYQNALAEYDNGRIASLVEFWKKRFEAD